MPDDVNAKPMDLDETSEAEELVHEAYEGKKITEAEVGEIEDVPQLEKEAKKIEAETAQFEAELNTPQTKISAEEVAVELPKTEIPVSAPISSAPVASEISAEPTKEATQEVSGETQLPVK